MISIVIPTLNEEKYVGSLLRCLVNQTYKDFEVIVVDGYSKDKTVEVVEKFKSKLDLKLVQTKKRGVAYQRNYGAKISSTDNLFFFDADSVIEPEFLEKVVRYLNTHPVDILTTWLEPQSDLTSDKFLFFCYNAFYLEVFKNFSPRAVGAFIYAKKKPFEDVGGFDESISFGEDHDLSEKMFAKGYKYALLRDPKLVYSVRRLDKDGRLKYALNLLAAGIYSEVKGPIKSDSKITKIIKYPFGHF